MVEPEIHEPDEVLPPARGPERERPRPDEAWKRWKRSWAPLVLGALLDLLDLGTFGPLGLRGGFLVGGVGAFLICSLYEIPLKHRLAIAVAAGLYCTLPGTERLPLATAAGLILRARAG